MIHIQEHLYDKDQYRSNLVDVLHETMDPLEDLYRELNKKSENGDEMALVIETLLSHSYRMQEQIVKYIESKTGKIKIVMDEKDKPWLFRTSMYITGVEINGKHIEKLEEGKN